MMMQIFLLLAVLVNTSAFTMGPRSFVPTGRMSLEMRERKCDLAGTRRNGKAMRVSKSNAHTHRVQKANIQSRKLWWEEGNKFVQIRITTRTLKTIQKNGLDSTAKKFGIDLNKFAVSSGTAPVKEEISA